MLAFLVLLLVIGAVHWYFVFSESARRKYAQPTWYFFKRSKQGRELDDALGLAVSLIVAVACSSVVVAGLIIILVNLFK